HLCAVGVDGRVECTPAISSLPSRPEGPVDSGDGFSCARSFGYYECRGAWSYFGEWSDGVAGELSACTWGPSSVECGRHPDGPTLTVPSSLTSVAAVFGGYEHYCALDSDGLPTCWGRNDHGQATPPAVPFVQLALGRHHSCGRTAVGSVICWGAGTPTADNGIGDHYGQGSPPPGTFVDLTAGESFTCGRFADGSLDCWGRWTESDSRAGEALLEPPTD
ncbi:MAG: hypothetical protein H6722_31605, partial [Sandaracinus sp.]|nr:hypothetical protein [Sandaracinus sp.]